MIDALTDHFIICGFGRVGRQVARDLRAAGARYVVDRREPRRTASSRPASACASSRAPPPTTRSCARPGSSARGRVIACVDSDAENIFITLSARELRPDIAIVAARRAEDSESQAARAGADAGDLALQGRRARRWRAWRCIPQVVRRGRRRAGVPAWRRSRWRPAATASARRSATSAAVRSSSACAPPTAAFEPQPPATTVLDAGDVLVAMGTPRTMDRLEALFAAPRAHGVGLVTPVAEPARRRRARRPPALCRGGRGGDGARRRSSARSRPSYGDYATNAAMLLAPVLEAPPREVAERLGEALRAAPRRLARRASRSPAPASSTCSSPTPGTVDALDWRARRRRRLRRRRREAGPSGSTSSSSRPTRPAR